MALQDDWAKGYSRLGAAYFGLEDFKNAVQAYSMCLSLDPDNALIKSSLADAKKEEEFWADLPELIPQEKFVQQQPA